MHDYVLVTLCMLGIFSCYFVVCRYFQHYFIQGLQVLSRITSECQTVLIWVQNVCKGYQQTTQVAAVKSMDEYFIGCLNLFTGTSDFHLVQLCHFINNHFPNTHKVCHLLSHLCLFVWLDCLRHRFQ